MRLMVLTLSTLLTISPSWAQRFRTRRVNDAGAGPSLNLHSMRNHAARSVTPKATAAPAPGVVVVSQDLLFGNVRVYFVATETIPKGSMVSGAITETSDS